MARIRSSHAPQPLGNGVELVAPGFRGEARRHPATVGGRRSIAVEEVDDPFVDAVRRAGFDEIEAVELDLQPVGLAAAGDQQTVTLRMPSAAGGVLAMALHESGAVRWELPVDAPDDDGTHAVTHRSGGMVQIPIRIPASAPGGDQLPGRPDEPRRRALVSAGLKLLVKVFVAPLVERVAGEAIAWGVSRWESSNRPGALRWADVPGSRRSGALDDADVARLADGPTLLVVHGTFSATASWWQQLPDHDRVELGRRYEDRVVLFDHPTVATAPAANVAWLADRMDPARTTSVDVLAHSRGGLVGRLWADHDPPRHHVRRLVCVGTPNAGTPLAEPARARELFDRVSTLVKLLPVDDVTSGVMDAVLVGLRSLLAGGLSHLDGLAAMAPAGEFLTSLNQAVVATTSAATGPGAGGAGVVASGAATGQRMAPTTMFGVAANWEPSDGIKQAFHQRVLHGGADALVDTVIGQDNDFVVPTVGVASVNGHDLAQQVLVHPSRQVNHVNMFQQRATHERLLDWLPGT